MCLAEGVSSLLRHCLAVTPPRVISRLMVWVRSRADARAVDVSPMPEVEVVDVEKPAGFGAFLASCELNMFEFLVCSGFWVAMLIASSFFSLGDVLSAWQYARAHARPQHGCASSRFSRGSGRALPALAGFPPIAMVLTGVSAASEYLPVTASVLGLLGGLYMMIKHRAFMMKATGTILRKLTGRKR